MVAYILQATDMIKRFLICVNSTSNISLITKRQMTERTNQIKCSPNYAHVALKENTIH